jgi:hypothetical protein
MAQTNQFLRGQLESFAEAWKRRHAEAMGYWDLRDALALSLALYDAILVRDRAWGDEIRSGRRQLDREEVREFERMYRGWEAPTPSLLASLKSIEQSGFAVEEAARFRTAVKDVRLKLAADLDAILEGEREIAEGRGIPLEEVRDELRRRRRAAGQ